MMDRVWKSLSELTFADGYVEGHDQQGRSIRLIKHRDSTGKETNNVVAVGFDEENNCVATFVNWDTKWRKNTLAKNKYHGVHEMRCNQLMVWP